MTIASDYATREQIEANKKATAVDQYDRLLHDPDTKLQVIVNELLAHLTIGNVMGLSLQKMNHNLNVMDNCVRLKFNYELAFTGWGNMSEPNWHTRILTYPTMKQILESIRSGRGEDEEVQIVLSFASSQKVEFSNCTLEDLRIHNEGGHRLTVELFFEFEEMKDVA